MKLEWMGEYRDIIEKLIRFSNGYSSVLHKKQYLGTDIAISFAQIQVVEYILENESYMQNMSKIAYRLGISYSTFSKLANSLVEMGLLQKFNISGNRKDIIIQATDYGKDQYIKYSKFMSEIWIKRIAQAGDAIPKEYLPYVAEMLDAASTGPDAEKSDKKLVPVKTAKKKNPDTI
ncbi:MAG: MarR family transcriptional regulator [Firmicutes bacterium HGW-Firmicutes-9]|jgi:DNA-binding MarR family transcriptional regulator|nr:MAG: MarR family transcriptional regulator [Firmicutes bacterium HGW-Firmicutes-9]